MLRPRHFAEQLRPPDRATRGDPAAHGPHDPLPLARRSLRATRWLGRAPRIAAICLVASLCAAGLRATLKPRAPLNPPRPTAHEITTDLAAEAFAQAFARSYLTWSPATHDGHDAAVARFAPNTLDAGAGLRPPSHGSQTVRWTAIAGDSRRGRTRLITVLVGTSGGDLTLAVPVRRDARGLLSVSAYPALIGPPPANPRTALDVEPPVEDTELSVVAKRTVTNYLARSPRNLAADLTSDAVVVMPVQKFRAARFDDVTWARPNRVAAVVVEALRRDGLQMTLRYELAVVRRAGRWLVRAIETNPIHPEVVP